MHPGAVAMLPSISRCSRKRMLRSLESRGEPPGTIIETAGPSALNACCLGACGAVARMSVAQGQAPCPDATIRTPT
jgi:hypothetical protein